MSETKAIGMAYLSHGQLGNHNAGEGGSQLSNLKMYNNKPYISGQALRHAVRDALREITDEGVDCSPEDACGEIETCKLCDILGYMNTDFKGGQDGKPNTRTSPLRVTPAVGQKEMPVTNDMVVQFGVGGSVKKEEDSDSDHGNSIGYRELIENTYRGSWMIDISKIGHREIEYMEGDEAGHRYNRQLEDYLDSDEKEERIKDLLTALQNHCHLAGQSRHMADFMPDLAVAATLPSYNQRVANSLHLRNEDELETNALQSVLQDIVDQGGEVYISGTYNPEVISNWDEVKAVVDSFGDEVQWTDSVTECYNKLKDQV